MEGSTDRISDLPSSILHCILSCLPDDDLARTPALSKQWNSVRKSYPFVYFKQPRKMSRIPFGGLEFKERLRRLLDSVDRSLHYFIQNKLCIEKFVLDAHLLDLDSVPVLDAWLPLALHNGVSDLCFDINVVSEEYSYSQYALPETTFAVDSSVLGASSKFFRLEKLALNSVNLSQRIISDIIKNCPGITSLCLNGISGLKTLNISKLDKLVTLIVSVAIPCYQLQSVSVDALSLEHFSFLVGEKYLPCQTYLTSCSNLRKLLLHDSSISNAEFHKQISEFPLLEVLDISLCEGLSRIRLSLQRLKRLKIHYCKGIRAIEIDAPALSSFKFANSHRRDLPTIVLSKLNFDPYTTRKPVIPPQVEVGYLDLTGQIGVNSRWWEATLEKLLSSCHPKIISVPTESFDEKDCVAILCKMLGQSERNKCCYRRHCICWRHRLKEAKIESICETESGGAMEYKHFPHGLDTVLWIPSSTKAVRFRLEWDLSAIVGSCHGLNFLERFSLSTRV